MGTNQNCSVSCEAAIRLIAGKRDSKEKRSADQGAWQQSQREVLPSLLAGTRVRFEGWIGMLSDLLDREEFFKKQTEECRDLARNAVNADDRAFWELAAKRWNEQLLAAKRANRPKRQTRRVAGNGTREAKARRAERVKRDCGRAPSTEMPRSPSFFLQIGALPRRLVSAF